MHNHLASLKVIVKIILKSEKKRKNLQQNIWHFTALTNLCTKPVQIPCKTNLLMPQFLLISPKSLLLLSLSKVSITTITFIITPFSVFCDIL